METVARTELRRSFDRSHHRKPLRLAISRRRSSSRNGGEEFVTQVSYGKKRAVLLPWQDGAQASASD